MPINDILMGLMNRATGLSRFLHRGPGHFEDMPSPTFSVHLWVGGYNSIRPALKRIAAVLLPPASVAMAKAPNSGVVVVEFLHRPACPRRSCDHVSRGVDLATLRDAPILPAKRASSTQEGCLAASERAYQAAYPELHISNVRGPYPSSSISVR